MQYENKCKARCSTLVVNLGIWGLRVKGEHSAKKLHIYLLDQYLPEKIYTTVEIR